MRFHARRRYRGHRPRHVIAATIRFEWRQDHTFSLFIKYFENFNYMGKNDNIYNVSSSLSSTSCSSLSSSSCSSSSSSSDLDLVDDFFGAGDFLGAVVFFAVLPFSLSDLVAIVKEINAVKFPRVFQLAKYFSNYFLTISTYGNNLISSRTITDVINIYA